MRNWSQYSSSITSQVKTFKIVNSISSSSSSSIKNMEEDQAHTYALPNKKLLHHKKEKKKKIHVIQLN